ncbi:hypothetical protein C8K44_1171, partial [Aminobacter sp. AP02]
MAAVCAGLDMTAKGCGATLFDRRHDLELLQAQMPGSTKDVGDLNGGAHASAIGRDLRRLEQAELVEWAR